MIYYVAGIVVAGLFPFLPSNQQLLIVVPVLLLAIVWRRVPGPVRAGLAGLLLAICWGQWQLSHRGQNLDRAVDYAIEGVVVGVPAAQPGRLRFNLALNGASSSPELARLRRVRLSWYQPAHPLQPGMQLSLKVRLFVPRGMANPGGFDYPRWLLSRGLDATGYVRSLAVIADKQCCVVDRLRAELAHWLTTQVPEPAVQATLAALLLGIKDGLSDAQWQILRQTGTVHLVVISGLHIGFAALAGAWLGRLISQLSGRYRQDHRQGMVIGALGLALIYMLLAGSAIPTQRAMLMLTVFLLSYLWLQSVSHWQRWWLALAVVLTFSPLSFYDAGLWLSFTAVAILLSLSGIAYRGGLAWRAQLAITLGMFPLLVGWFGGSALLSPLVNLVAIPFTAVLLLFATLTLGLAGLGLDWLLPLLSGVIEGCWWVLDYAAGLPGSYLKIAAPPNWALGLALLGSGLWLLPGNFPWRWVAPLCWLPMLAGGSGLTSGPDFEAWLLDVGQGLSLYVRSGERHLLYDTGPGYRSGGSAVNSAVLPALKQWRVPALDLLVLSHRDNDHAGGRRQLLEVMPARQRLSGSAQLVADEGYAACVAGQQWHWGDTRLSMLAGSKGAKENARSCVLLIEHRGCRLLATGDIGFAEEARLPAGKVNWLLASHHGSRYGTSELLLQRTRPDLLLISAGATNPFGHPHPDVLARAAAQGVPVAGTAQLGALRLTVPAQGQCLLQGWRARQSHYWQIP